MSLTAVPAVQVLTPSPCVCTIYCWSLGQLLLVSRTSAVPLEAINWVGLLRVGQPQIWPVICILNISWALKLTVPRVYSVSFTSLPICSLSVVLSPFLLLITHIFAVSLFFSTTIKKRLSILLVFSKHWSLDSLNFSTSYYFLLHQFKSLSLLLFPRFHFYVLFLNS